jgi:diguanylate cyclase (GGDEF)-like protein
MQKKGKTVPFNKYLEKLAELEKKETDKKNSNKMFIENRYLYSLLKITKSINTPQDFNLLLELIVDSAIAISKAERGFLMLFGKDGNLEFRVTQNIDRRILVREKFEISKTVVNHVLASGKSIFLGDIYKDKKIKISESIEALGLHMIMCVPLKAKKNILGVIYVDSHSETENFTPLEERMLEAFAAQTSVAIENSHLYDMSVHDGLTGLYNYGYLRNRFEEEITRASQFKKGTISFIMLDLDNFKKINDSYGHLFGNSILVKVAERIKETVRKYDVAARYGGDEFAILLPGADNRDARYLAERLQKEITEIVFTIGKKTISISSSIGISTFPVEKIIDIETIVVEADHALFIAKSKGGNQIATFSLKKDTRGTQPVLIGDSAAIHEVRKAITKLARTDATLLIIGETGTGKELITRAVHQESARADKPLVVVNCGAIPDNLLESELFGYEKGAFTGAYRQHKGKFEIAQGGSIFFDEVGDIPLHLQVKLLRAIEQKEIDRIGGKTPIKIDVRVIAASNRDLEDEVKKGNFRKDFYYRLNVATLFIPPLRERPEDIELLSTYYLEQMNRQYHRKFSEFTKGAIQAMVHHPWPGNVRELIHRIERAVIMGTGNILDENDLGLVLAISTTALRTSKDKIEKECIMQALVRNCWNITRAAKQLEISRETLRYLIKKHLIVKPQKTTMSPHIHNS